MTTAPARFRLRPRRRVRPGIPSYAVLVRVYPALLVAQAPLLAVLLAPQGRSRVSSESTAGLLTVLLLGLVAAAVLFSPVVCARVAPAGERWRAGSALATVRALIRTDRRAYLRRLGEFAALYVLAQCLGGLVVWARPYIRDNPLYGIEPSADRWEFHHGNYAVQAIVIYLVVCAATTWYACRLRQLAADQPAAG